MGFNPAIPIAHAEQPQTRGVRYLKSRTPNRFAVLSRPGIDQPLQPDLSMRYGLYDARGYDYPVERRYDDVLAGHGHDAATSSSPPSAPAQGRERCEG